MALKTEKTDVSPEATKAAPVQATTVLELAMYKMYTWGGVTYEAGKPYRFRSQDAMMLLSETDMDRPIWKIYQQPKAKQVPKNEVVDATSAHASLPVEELGGVPSEKRLEVGSDDEIADILNPSDGDVTV